MSALFALRVDPRGQEAGLTTPLSFLRNWVGQEPSRELWAFFHCQTGERAFVPLKDQDTQRKTWEFSEELAVDSRRTIC